MSNPKEAWGIEPDLDSLNKAYRIMYKNPLEATKEFINLADQGSIKSLNYLGYIYKSGLLGSKDLEESRKWYEKSYKLGSLRGLIHLGRVYLRQNNYQDAKKIFEEGVRIGDKSSKYWLAKIYTKQGIKLQEARNLLEDSMSQGHVFAEISLGILFMQGHFGIWKILPGLWHYLRGVTIGITLYYRDPSSSRLI